MRDLGESLAPLRMLLYGLLLNAKAREVLWPPDVQTFFEELKEKMTLGELRNIKSSYPVDLKLALTDIDAAGIKAILRTEQLSSYMDYE
jgi:hypothetical protein